MNNKLSTKRVECPECGTNALAPVIDHTKANGIDDSKGYCYVCQQRIGVSGPRHMTRAQRLEQLQLHYKLSTDDNVRLRNGLSTLLVSLYGQVADDHLRAWDVGTDGIGNCVFWYRNVDNVLQSAKIVPYDETTGKRKKGLYSPIFWKDKDKTRHVDNLFGIVTGTNADESLRIVSYASDKGYRVPLYGSQFIGATSPDVPVLLVEAEKTAVIASMFLQPFVVVATGGAGALTKERAQILAGRDVYVILDADDAGRNSTDKTVETLRDVGARPVVRVDGRLLVDYLLPDADKGFDIADYYLANAATIRPEITAEIPQSVLEPSILPDLEQLDLSTLPTVDLDNDTLPTVDLDVSTLQLPTVESINYNNVDAVRSSLLRAFGDVNTLPLDELHERLEQRRIAGGRSVVSAATITKPQLLRLEYETRSGQYVAVLERAAL